MKRGQKHNILNKIKTLVLFELLYKSIFLIVMVPLLEFTFKLTLKLSRYSYITLGNLAGYLASPVSLVVWLLVMIVAALFFSLEMISLYVLFFSSDQLKRIRVSHVLFPGLWQAKKLMKDKHNILIPLFCLLSTFMYCFPVFFVMLLKQRVPSYMIDSMLKAKFVIVALIAVVIVLFLIAFYGMFTLPYACLDDLSFKEAYKMSIKTIKGHLGTISVTLLRGNLLVCLIYVIVYYLSVFGSGLIIFLTVQDSLATTFFLSVYDFINRYYAVAVGVLGVVVNCQLILKLFLQFKLTQIQIDERVISLQARISREDRTVSETQKSYWKLNLWYRICHGRFTRIVAITAAGAAIIISGYMSVRMGTWLRFKAPLFSTAITAHRGYSQHAPENTIPSINAAIDSMSDYAEIDVQQTKDGVIVLLHDTNLKRTTGVNKQLWNVTYDELMTIDAGYKFKSVYPDTKIPTLAEVLELCQNKIFLNIEIKLNGHEQKLVEQVVELIRQYDMEDQCIISSTNYGVLTRVKETDSPIKTGYIMSMAYGYFYNMSDADFYSIKSSFITEEMVKLAHSYGKEVHAWTVNNVSEMERMKKVGVDNIITDNPVRAREVMYEDKLTSSFVEFMQTMIK